MHNFTCVDYQAKPHTSQFDLKKLNDYQVNHAGNIITALPTNTSLPRLSTEQFTGPMNGFGFPGLTFSPASFHLSYHLRLTDEIPSIATDNDFAASRDFAVPLHSPPTLGCRGPEPVSGPSNTRRVAL
ncbi:hypothetical protein J6590_075778 [Homalodisca vitripennis]|nr:hypothetical protein J6590_075778 [Homalodisca vitripennis]